MFRLLLLALLPLLPATALAEIRLGILAPQGAAIAEDRWRAFANRLGAELGEPITIISQGAAAGTESFANREIDFLIGNPVQTAVAVDTMSAITLLSVVSGGRTHFAGVIAVRADSRVQSIADIRETTVATLGDWAAGGYVFQAHHVLRNGVGHINTETRRVKGANQRDLVQKLLSGQADVAFIRTGLIEEMVAEGSLSADSLRVLDQQDGNLMRTTSWYPEWFVVAQNHTDPALLVRMKQVLLGFDADDPEMSQARVTKFRDPLNLQPLIVALQDLGVAPYN
ncbi:MAG: PhnD/SsuA/transferrin family substrate-binding protein [Pseudomonadota bacterium]